MKVLLLDFEISRLQLLPDHLIKGKEKALPVHTNAIKEQYKSSSIKTVLPHQTTGLQDSTVVKKKEPAVNNKILTYYILELSKT